MNSDGIVTLWWATLTSFSVLNVLLWFMSKTLVTRFFSHDVPTLKLRKWQTILSGGYVWGCAYRAILPRVDAQRLCLFDIWLSSIFLGRFVATVAELFFVSQFALLLAEVGKRAESKTVGLIAWLSIPLIGAAEMFSWYAVLTTNFYGHAIEESIWALVAILLTGSVFILWPRFDQKARRIFGVFAVLGITYVGFMVFVDIPMYISRWTTDQNSNQKYLGLFDGLMDSIFTRRPSHFLGDWIKEMPWMTFYFVFAVWISISLIFVPKLIPLPRLANGREISDDPTTI